MLRLTLTMMLTLFALTSGAYAQSLNPGPPGPFVFDIRAATSNMPTDPALFPELSTEGVVPGRGFGGSVGGHFYALHLGPARLGLGVDVMMVRGSTADASSLLLSVDPQISMNFGTANGWSTLSAGVGVARISGDPGGVSESVRSFNWGGGARWFVNQHIGVGFDLRFHYMAAGDVLPKDRAVSIAAGLALK